MNSHLKGYQHQNLPGGALYPDWWANDSSETTQTRKINKNDAILNMEPAGIKSQQNISWATIESSNDY